MTSTPTLAVLKGRKSKYIFLFSDLLFATGWTTPTTTTSTTMLPALALPLLLSIHLFLNRKRKRGRGRRLWRLWRLQRLKKLFTRQSFGQFDVALLARSLALSLTLTHTPSIKWCAQGVQTKGGGGGCSLINVIKPFSRSQMLPKFCRLVKLTIVEFLRASICQELQNT